MGGMLWLRGAARSRATGFYRFPGSACIASLGGHMHHALSAVGRCVSDLVSSMLCVIGAVGLWIRRADP